MTAAATGVIVEKLSATERAELRQLEGIVEAGIDIVERVGVALRKIQEKRLYRETHSDFGTYVRERFGMGRQYGYRLIAAAVVSENLSPMGDIALPERQARVLAPLQPENQRLLAQQAVERSGETGEPITTAMLEDLRRQAFTGFTPEEQRDVINDAEADAVEQDRRQRAQDGQRDALDQLGRRSKLCLKLCGQVGPEADEAAACAKQLIAAVGRIELPAG